MTDMALSEKADLEAVVRQHGADIALIERDIETVKGQLGDIRKSISGQDAKLDRVLDTLRIEHGTTVETIKQWLNILVMAGALVGGVVTGIVYIAGNSQATDIALLRYRVEQMSGNFSTTWNTSTASEKGYDANGSKPAP